MGRLRKADWGDTLCFVQSMEELNRIKRQRSGDFELPASLNWDTGLLPPDWNFYHPFFWFSSLYVCLYAYIYILLVLFPWRTLLYLFIKMPNKKFKTLTTNVGEDMKQLELILLEGV